MPPRPKPPPDSEIEESYLKGSGPGGQKINKTSSAVQLKHIPTGVVVKSQATRSRTQNRKIAREILAQKLDDLQNGNQSRSAIVGEVKRKKAASASKKSKRKYRQLAEEKAQGETAEVEVKEQRDEDQTNSAPSAHSEPTTPTDTSPHVQNPKP
ncbi:RF-1 domain-containing protein [Colletotrichum caudatum]|nr:RF-1 domain-containing protein [Colletotrichum caudatum]